MRAVLLLLAPLLVLAAADPVGEWPQFRGPRRDGVSAERGWSHAWPAEGPVRRWRHEVGAGYSSVAISGGALYTLGNSGDQDSVWCLDAASGALRWRHRYASPLDPRYYSGGPSATPAVADGAVYTLSKAGQVFCLDAASGAVRWTRELAADPDLVRPAWGFAGSPLIESGLLLLNVGRGGLALDRATGAVVWTSGRGECGYAGPVAYDLDGTRMLAVFGKDALRGVELRTGRERWSHPWPTAFGENSPDPLAADGALFLSTGHGLGAALLDLGAGGQPTVRWTNADLGNHIASSVRWGGCFYGFSGRVNKDGGALICVDAATGATRWTVDGLRGSLIVADGRLIILTLQGELVIARADPAGYAELARAQVLGGTCWTAPVLCGGRIVVRNAKGELASLDLARD